MKKAIIRGIDKFSKSAKKIAIQSPNTVSTFLFYEPKAPESIRSSDGKIKKN